MTFVLGTGDQVSAVIYGVVEIQKRTRRKSLRCLSHKMRTEKLLDSKFRTNETKYFFSRGWELVSSPREKEQGQVFLSFLRATGLHGR